MHSWQKRARIGVAIFGLAVAAFVYFAMRDRETPAPPAPVQRTDPKAIMETTGCDVERRIFTQKSFTIACDQWRVYEDGSTKFDNLTLTVPKGENRTFKVAAREGSTGQNEDELTLAGDVKLEDSDGFVLTTARGTFKQSDAIAHAPEAVSFSKGRMSGSGVGISYDQAHDLLVIGADARISTRDEAGNTFLEFTAGNARLDRVAHVLTLEGDVHIMRAGQIIEADHAVAQLTANDDIITFIQLRGDSRVEGGGSSIDAMSARDIDLDYTDDGTRLEVVTLTGTAAVAMVGQNGGGGRDIIADVINLTLSPDGSSRMVLTTKASIVTAGATGGTGRTIAGEALEIDLAADGTITRAVGRENVRLDLPNPAGGPGRSIRTRQLDATGAAGQGLTSATFNGDVHFTEQAAKGTAARTVRAQKLEAAMTGDEVKAATFTGEVTFEERGLKACAARLEYQPDKGSLALSGSAPGAVPTVAEEQVNIEAPTIDVELTGQNRHIVAKGGVTTRMGSGTRCRPAEERATAQRGATRIPGLLDPKAAITIRAATLDYEGGTGKAVYTGLANNQASITQGTTAILADAIVIDQSSGDLTATGNAMVDMALDAGTSTGSAHEIRYREATRLITYSAPPAGYVAPLPVPGVRAFREPTLRFPQGHLSAASRISVVLAKEGARAERIEARNNVTMRLGTTAAPTRVITGGATMVYDPVEKKYVMSAPAAGTTLVKIVERSADRTGTTCRELTGRSVTFFETGDTIVIDGQQRSRTQAAPSTCPATVAR